MKLGKGLESITYEFDENIERAAWVKWKWHSSMGREDGALCAARRASDNVLRPNCWVAIRFNRDPEPLIDEDALRTNPSIPDVIKDLYRETSQWPRVYSKIEKLIKEQTPEARGLVALGQLGQTPEVPTPAERCIIEPIEPPVLSGAHYPHTCPKCFGPAYVPFTGRPDCPKGCYDGLE